VSARLALKVATQAEHDRVDALFSRLDLANGGDYRLFLTAQAAAHLPIEAALDAAGAERVLADWPNRKRGDLLRADLTALAADLPPPLDPPALASDAAILGAIYVLEGSRLGGAVLKRQVPADAPRAFLNPGQAQGRWRKLLEKLDEDLYEPGRIGLAADAARHVFERFYRAGQIYLEGRF
jgi:heme oxygenase (biliverdin-IX-beta and delta-forming)